MTDDATVREAPVAGPVPRFEIPGWRKRYGVVAGITGRGTGGGEEGDFDLGLWTRAPVADVMTRWREFRQAEPGFHAHVMAHQAHGARLARHGETAGWVVLDGVDGHVTSRPGVLLLVTAADCIPIYLTAPREGAVALLHAGWRGTAAGILERGIRALARKVGVPPAELAMHCGVGICGDCYEVGAEVMAACGVPAEGRGPWHLDLRSHLAARGRALGLVNITRSAWCSAHDRPTFFSHRASGGTDGRMVAYLGRPDWGTGTSPGREAH
ncbi:MAG TPA: polyphenol oxidase family protein [Gemmatimonadales bacterium]|nr:polyphenol oxidase family protein [Gemmatimonadales bacterium]